MTSGDEDTVPIGETGVVDDKAPGGTIGRFVVQGSLGSGGMGVVLAAWDPTLERRVALKLLRPDSVGGEEGRARLQREAQAMARVQHPNVATIYEVGTVGEQLFVAMELVDGETLKGWLRARPRTQREALAMLVAAGRGLSAVHAAGVVHRDFKPDNVLVGSDGRPRVSDFGLVSLRGAAVAGTGAVTMSAAGTPAYMSPEQARGEVGDARSDQFSFCVAVWEALWGARPFANDAPPEARHAPPRPPLKPRVPARLLSILSRGLASEPSDRWPSMDALLAALERDTSARRLRLVGLVSLALVGVVSLGGWLQTRRSATARIQRAGELGRETQQMRTMMRAAHLLPLHDIKPDREKVRAFIRRIESQMAELGDEGRGQAEAALGAGYFAINNRPKALEHLQNAWAAGQHSPEVAFDLGQTLVFELQRRRLTQPAPADPEKRKSYEADLRRTLRDPAIAYLRQAGDAPETSPDYIEEVIAWAERRMADTEKHGELAFAEIPTLYEAGLIAASALAHDAFVAQRQGKPAEADLAYGKAQAMYRRVIEIGRSDDAVYKLAGDHLSALAYERAVGGKDTDAELRATVEYCRKGQAADSEAVWPDEMMARIYEQLTFIDSNHGRDSADDSKNAIAAAERALARNPKSAMTYTQLGNIWLDRADSIEENHGIDSRASLRKAAESYEKAIALGATADANNSHAQADAKLARWQMAHGLDPTETIERTFRYSDDAMRMMAEDNAGFAHRMQCQVLTDYAHFLIAHGKDARAVWERAEPLCAALAKESGGEPIPVELPGYLAAAEAAAAARSGGEPLPLWRRAQASMEAALKLNPKSVDFRSDLVDTLSARAEYESALFAAFFGHDLDGKADVARAINEARQAIKDDASDAKAHRALARAELAAARVALHAKKNPAADVKEGQQAVERTLAIKGDDGAAMLIGAELDLIAHDPAALAHGQALVTRALAIDATHPRLLSLRSELSTHRPK